SLREPAEARRHHRTGVNPARAMGQGLTAVTLTHMRFRAQVGWPSAAHPLDYKPAQNARQTMVRRTFRSEKNHRKYGLCTVLASLKEPGADQPSPAPGAAVGVRSHFSLVPARN